MYKVRIMQTVNECFRGKDVVPNLQELIDSRIKQAIDLRRTLGLSIPCNDSTSVDSTTTVWRMVNSEGDRLSGLVIDVVGNHIVVSSSAAWVEANRELVISAIQRHASWVDGITWRQARELLKEEGWLDEKTGPLTGSENSSSSRDDDIDDTLQQQEEEEREEREEERASVQVIENGALFLVDPLGQKTGFYADQREHRAFIKSIAHGKDVLDLCCYTGAFSIQAALGGATRTLGVDSSNAALELAKQNAVLNNVSEICSFEKGDVAEYMKLAHAEGKKFDIVILDPPKLAPNRKALQKAMRKYLSLNVAAFRLVKSGGLLMTCSCSGAVAASHEFQSMVQSAAQRADRRVSLLKEGRAAPCHPIDPGYPEGVYLTNATYHVA